MFNPANLTQEQIEFLEQAISLYSIYDYSLPDPLHDPDITDDLADKLGLSKERISELISSGQLHQKLKTYKSRFS